MRNLKLLAIAFCFVFAGCGQKTVENPFPKPLELGAQIETFEPARLSEKSELPVETIQTPVKPEAPRGILNLRQALGLALLENPELKSFSWQVRAEQAGQLQASLKPNPELSVDVEDFGGTGGLNRFKGYESTLAVSQLIEVGGKRAKREHVASLEKEIASWDYESKRLGVFADVVKAYTEVLSTQQRVELDAELLRLSEELVKTVSGRVEAGKDAPLDEIKAQIVLANIKIFHQQVLNELAYARRELASLWAGQPEFTKAGGKLEMPEAIPTLEKLFEYLKDNPDVIKANLQVKKAKAAYQLEKARGKQDVTVSGGVKRIEQNKTNAFIVGISVPIGVSDRNQGNRRKAMYEYAKALEEQRAVVSALQSELSDQYKEMANAFTAATQIKQKIIPAAKEVFIASKTSYGQGKLNYLNVLDSQRTLFQSSSQYVEALSDYHKAKAEVERLITKPIK